MWRTTSQTQLQSDKNSWKTKRVVMLITEKVQCSPTHLHDSNPSNLLLLKWTDRQKRAKCVTRAWVIRKKGCRWLVQINELSKINYHLTRTNKLKLNVLVQKTIIQPSKRNNRPMNKKRKPRWEIIKWRTTLRGRPHHHLKRKELNHSSKTLLPQSKAKQAPMSTRWVPFTW